MFINVEFSVSIPACHAGDRGSIPRRGEDIFVFLVKQLLRNTRYHANPSLWVFFKLTIAWNFFVIFKRPVITTYMLTMNCNNEAIAPICYEA